MSVVTNVIISGMSGLDVYRPFVIEALNAYLVNAEAERDLGTFTQVDQHAGGRKAIERHVWMGAFNYLEIDEFMAVYHAVLSQRGRFGRGYLPQLLMCRQDDNKFYEMPNEPDGRDWHYRDTTQDRIPQ